MIDLAETSELLTFVRVVELRSLSEAARELAVPRSTVGRRLQRLETRLGLRLLKRTTRTQTLTDAGEEFYRHARIALAAIERAQATLTRPGGEVQGLVRIAVPGGNGTSFGDMFTEFAHRHPAVRLEVQASSLHVDLVAKGFDLALRAGIELGPNLVSRVLGRMSLVAVASPAYLKTNGVPRRAHDLRHHQCLTGYLRGEYPQMEWPLLRGGTVRIEPRLAANDLNLLVRAAERDLGIALVPEVLVTASLQAGALVRVLATTLGVQGQMAIVYHEREFMPAAVRALIDFIVDWDPMSRI